MAQIIFSSEELKRRLLEVVRRCTEHEIDFFLDEIDLDSRELDDETISSGDFLNNVDYEEDVLINEDTVLKIGLPRATEYHFASIDGVYEMIELAIHGKIEDNFRFLSPCTVLYHVAGDHILLQEEKIDFSISQTWEGIEINVIPVKGLSSYGFKLVMDGTYDKYFPPVESYDLFIKIKAKEELKPAVFDDIIQAYIFELQNSHAIDIRIETRLTNVSYDDVDTETCNTVGDNLRLRPLLNGKGITPLLKIYNSCNNIEDNEFRILNYTKIIEYVSQTVINKEMLDSILKKLYSPKVLQPDATYILELERLYDEHRNNKKDNQAISLTVGTCCDTIELIEIAPKYLKKFSEFKKQKDSKDLRSQCLDELAGAISDTRNMIAHAKTNYRMKGKECPKDQLGDFATCLKMVASQVIHWFARQHEDSRII
ncbi:hypothetical protein [Paenibacillus cucumis (ex Kampfer et al. 2016)]|uniref:ApeA N-terminal domain-containing protein n=1 Tax=Paenibacillus cucumis (ex Kampfer et al. 2016) TaxID=1776858 RepID=A0ABS7KCY3_9BACL|nr:hypothetical protein [Paenibacillus cucumis (ex Kampfer et al. 2016)]MBY0202012.1 hypothetical protein [Paenibacillus cucumis (ex Kampfer et al. 2016)]